jgi:branched-chain amino acid transport system ATP-binding protein
MTLLVAENLEKRFGGVVAARGVSLSVAAGEIVAVIGPNGAGKSTLFGMIGGQIVPDRGRVLLDGRSLQGCAPRERFRLGIGRTFQVAQTFLSMTVAENVQMALVSARGDTRHLTRPARAFHRADAKRLLERVGLVEAAGTLCSTLAYGDLKRVEFAMALAGAPKLLLMDEPTAGMSPRERGALIDLVAAVARAERIGVLFTEHDMDVVFGHADRVLVLVRGAILAEGPPATVRANPQVQEVYLGAPTGGAPRERAR